jgi:hypothetical protein
MDDANLERYAPPLMIACTRTRTRAHTRNTHAHARDTHVHTRTCRKHKAGAPPARAQDLRELHGLPEEATPPVVALFHGGKPVSWHSDSGTAASSEDGVAVRWTTDALVAWAYSQFHVRTVADEEALHAFHRASAERVAIGFYPRLCQGDAGVFVDALRAHAKRTGKGIAAAISTNLTLASDACGLDSGGVCALLNHGKGARLTLPEHIPHSVIEIDEWLGSIVGSAAQHEENSKAEL